MLENDPPPPARPAAPPPAPTHWLQYLTLFLAIVLLLALAALYAGPGFLLRWRSAEAQADAEAAYLKRQAELKAEAEAADKRLAALDSKVKLTALGFRAVARKVLPSVVNVSNERAVDPDAVPFFRRRRTLFYDYLKDRVYEEVSMGSGILVQPGLVLTNNHVVAGAQRLRVTFANGDWVAVGVDQGSEDFDPRSLAADPVTDLAVIRLPEDRIKHEFHVTATFADSDKDVQVGDWALAVGSPLGLEQTMTAGIISYKGRALRKPDVDVLQTDAAINPGSSGGPLFDQFGRVIGINVAIASRTGGNQGIGFAIPSNTAKEIFRQLAETGEVVRGFLGVSFQELPLSRLAELGLSETGGVLIQLVLPGGPARRAGLEPGDVVVRFNGQAVGRRNSRKGLKKQVQATRPGQRVPVEIVRQGRHLTRQVRVGKMPPER
jgi:S1-C subfamily serine protease